MEMGSEGKDKNERNRTKERILNQKKTANNFIKLGGTISEDLPEYLKHNQNMKLSTILIFQLRG